MKKSLAFTLGEILIALGVIGVIASLVLPQLVIGHKSSIAKAQFETAHNLLVKTFADMEADGLDVSPTSFTASQSLYKKLKPYSRVVVDCGDFSSDKNSSVCVNYGAKNQSGAGDNYTTYPHGSKTKIYINRLDDGGFVLNNGMLVAFENPGGAGELWISVDINGKNKLPNKWGWDLFTFELTNKGLLPVGAPGTTKKYSNVPLTYCNQSSKSQENGVTCGYYAVTDKDYFKKIYKGH